MATFSAPSGPLGPGIPDSPLAGPFPVGEYAAKLRSKLRSFTHVQLMGEVVNLRPSRARVYFELRDATGAVPCSAWRGEWEAIQLAKEIHANLLLIDERAGTYRPRARVHP